MAIFIFIFAHWLFAFWCIFGVWKSVRRKHSSSLTISLNEICVIIPFRNEEHRIAPLLESCEKALPRDVECLFVDDHSSDQTSALIQKQHPAAKVILNSGSGKKQAIATGIGLTDKNYILTWDADISFSRNYWNEIEKLDAIDMHILPVKFKGNLIQKFVQLDTELTQIINYAQSGWSKPIIASGANFLFRRSAYVDFSQQDHFNLASGDDQFLLRDFKKNKATIQLQTNVELAVNTPCEANARTLLKQRLRWLSKTPKTKDVAAIILALLPFLLTMSWFALGIYYVSQYNWASAWLLYSAKLFLDFLICLRYFTAKKELGQLLLLPLFEIYFPIYSLVIGVLSIIYQPTWKERPIR